jgi:DNA replicative helicase MCM subunit Mcm2 (Cdc46/Mcm family)
MNATEEVTVEHSYHKFSLKQLIRKCKLYEPELRGGSLLSKYYIEERKNAEKVTTARAFESLCRLSEAHAKLMMRDYTTNFDCLTAIMLTEGLFAATEEQYLGFAEAFSSKYGIDLRECLEN